MEQVTKEQAIIFSPPMVQALKAGDKTQTRRIVKLPNGRVSKKPRAMPEYIGSWVNSAGSDLWAGFGSGEARPDGVQNTVNTMRTGWFPCPYGKVGDRLWVREAWREQYQFDNKKPSEIDASLLRFYEADNKLGVLPSIAGRYRNARFMPRAISRVLLEVVRVRVERLINISTADAIAEGIEQVLCPTTGTVPAKKWRNYLGRAYQDGMNLNYATESYLSLWNSLHGTDAHLENPWVWVVEFKVIAPASLATTAIEKEATQNL